VQQDPTPENLHTGLAQKEHHLRGEHYIDKVDVLVLDTDIYNALGKKGKDKLQQAPYKKSNTQLNEQTLILEKVLEQKAQRFFVRTLPMQFMELWGDLQQQGNALLCLFCGIVTNPAGQKLFFGVGDKSVGWVRNMDHIFFYGIDHYKVAFVPMNDTGQRDFF